MESSIVRYFRMKTVFGGHYKIKEEKMEDVRGPIEEEGGVLNEGKRHGSMG